MRDGDPLWTQSDTDLAIALTVIEAERCDCGHPRSESMHPDSEYAYTADPIRCHACAARDRAARGVDETWDDAGIHWSTSRKGRVMGGD